MGEWSAKLKREFPTICACLAMTFLFAGAFVLSTGIWAGIAYGVYRTAHSSTGGGGGGGGGSALESVGDAVQTLHREIRAYETLGGSPSDCRRLLDKSALARALETGKWLGRLSAEPQPPRRVDADALLYRVEAYNRRVDRVEQLYRDAVDRCDRRDDKTTAAETRAASTTTTTAASTTKTRRRTIYLWPHYSWRSTDGRAGRGPGGARLDLTG